MSDAESGKYSYSKVFVISKLYLETGSSRIDDSQTRAEDADALGT
jgi:hypothetical protein